MSETSNRPSSPRWPLDEGQDEFERITQDMRQEQHDDRLTSMNVALQTWRRGRFALDWRPRWQWGRGAPGMLFLGRISVRWYR